MNKLTKVLSIFLIAGLIGTGAAVGMSGCGDNGTTPEETPGATQTNNFEITFNLQGHGTAIDKKTTDDDGKITAPAAPSEQGYVFKGWYKEAACTNSLDLSGAFTANTTAYAKWVSDLEDAGWESGVYYEPVTDEEVTIDVATRKVTYNEAEFGVTVLEDGKVTFGEDDVLTLGKTDTGYEFVKESTDSNGKSTKTTLQLIKFVDLGVNAASFKGVYSLGEHGFVYSQPTSKDRSKRDFYKLTELTILEDGSANFKAIQVADKDGAALQDAEEFVFALDALQVQGAPYILHNKLVMDIQWSFEAVDANVSGIKINYMDNLDLTGSDNSLEVTKDASKQVEARPTLPVEPGAVYEGAYASFGRLKDGKYWFNDISYSAKVISGNNTDGYLVSCYTIDGYSNYVIKFVTTGTGEEATTVIKCYFPEDLEQVIDTLELVEVEEVEVVDFVADGTTSNCSEAIVDGLGWFTVPETGWYTFNVIDGTVYTVIDEATGEPNQGDGYIADWGGDPIVQLTKGKTIATTEGAYFTVSYSETKPVSTSIEDVYGKYVNVVGDKATATLAVSATNAKFEKSGADAVIFTYQDNSDNEFFPAGWTKYINGESTFIVKISGTTVTVAVTIWDTDNNRGVDYEYTIDVSTKTTVATDEFEGGSTGGGGSQEEENDFAGFANTIQGKYHASTTNASDETKIIEIEIGAKTVKYTLYDTTGEAMGWFDGVNLTYKETDEEYSNITYWTFKVAATQETFNYKIVVMGEAISFDDGFCGKTDIVLEAGEATFVALEDVELKFGENEEVSIVAGQKIAFTATTAGYYMFSWEGNDDLYDEDENAAASGAVYYLAANQTVKFTKFYGTFEDDITVSDVSNRVVQNNGALSVGVNLIVLTEGTATVSLAEGTYVLSKSMMDYSLTAKFSGEEEFINFMTPFTVPAGGANIVFSNYTDMVKVVVTVPTILENNGTMAEGNNYVNLAANGTVTLNFTTPGTYSMYVSTYDSEGNPAATISSAAYADYTLTVPEGGATVTLTASADWAGGIIVVSIM